MSLVAITAPKSALDLSGVKAHLRLEPDESYEDATVASLIATAQAWLDGPGGWLGRPLGEQTLELRASGFGGVILPMASVSGVGFVRDLVSVAYLDPSGMPMTLDIAGCAIEDGGALARPPGPLFRAPWPATFAHPQAVRVRYRVGYPDATGGPVGGTVPAPIRHAMLLLIGHWFENRMAVSPVAMVDLPMGVEALLAPWRVWGV